VRNSLLAKGSDSEQPVLLDRILTSGCTRIAVVGLHPGSGARSVVECLASDMQHRGVVGGVTRAPRTPLDAETATESVPRVRLPEGTLIATASALGDPEPMLQPLERCPEETSLGSMTVYRVVEAGRLAVHGPDDPGSMDRVLKCLGRHVQGPCLVDGAWDRRAFAAPGVTDAMVLTIGAGYSDSPERSALAARYFADSLALSECDEPGREAWEQAASGGALVALDEAGNHLGQLPQGLVDPVSSLHGLNGGGVRTVVLPSGLHDGFLAPLIRSEFRCTLVVRDPTCVHAAPVYLKAWSKGKGAVRVVREARLLAVAANPSSASGPDTEAQAFLRLVTEAVPHLPVHDVRLDAEGGGRKPFWKVWS
jgi:hypothetical protein